MLRRVVRSLVFLIVVLMTIAMVCGVALGEGYMVRLQKSDGTFVSNYDGLAKAIEKVNTDHLTNPTYLIGRSFDVTNPITMENATLDLQNHTLTIKNNVTFTNVTINNGSFTVAGNYSLTFVNVTQQGWHTSGENSGGVIKASDGAHIVVKNSTMQDNSAFEGAAIRAKDGVRLTVLSSNFINNHCSNGGGAILLWNATAEIRDSTFDGNTASWTAGAIFSEYQSNLKVYGTTFQNNKAGIRGGAVTVRRSHAEFLDFNGKPTLFENNLVEDCPDFGGGGLFIDVGWVQMQDVLITENSARDGGGGLSTCTTGTAQIGSLHGAAIYGNSITSSANIIDSEIRHYQDVFFHTRDHLDHRTGQLIDGRDYFQTADMKYALYEQMFNGGLHQWSGKTVPMWNEGHELYSYIAQSNPTIKSNAGAKVIFRGNKVNSSSLDAIVSGGGIADNGLLIIGSSTEIKIVKVWKNDHPETRPSEDDLLKHVNLYKNGKNMGDLYDLRHNPSSGVTIEVWTGNEAKTRSPYSNIILENDPNLQGVYDPNAKKWKIPDNTYWLIVVSGLEENQSYSVAESRLSGYEIPAISGTVITNTLETISIDVNKDWNDAGHEGARPHTVTVRLHANGEEVGSRQLTADNNWQATFTDLPVYHEGVKIHYTITEDHITDYTAEYDQDDFIVTNTYNPGKTNVVVEKEWEDHENQDGVRPASIQVHLLANGKDTGKSLVLNESNEWFGEFQDLDEKQNGQIIQYTVKEDSVALYTGSITGNMNQGFVLINRHQPEETSLTVNKIWVHKDNLEANHPEEITIRLHANGTEKEVRELTATNDWSTIFEHLPKYESGDLIHYVITEDHVKDYTHHIDETTGTITNTYNPNKTDVEVEKEWLDEHNKDGIRPAQITVHLYANGSDTGKSLILSEKNSWYGSFEAVDEFDAGNRPITYTIREDSVPGYETFIVGDAIEGFTVGNEHKPEEDDDYDKMCFHFTKVWSGGTSEDVDFDFYTSDGKPLHKTFHKKVINENEWYYEAWFNVDPGDYVIEKELPGYSAQYENKGKYARTKDRLYNGGTVINTKIMVPQTGDRNQPMILAVVAAGSCLAITIIILRSKRRKAV